MPFQLSPGVNVSEIDLTTIVPSVATSIGAFAGPFAWGPVGEIVTISDEVRLVDRFGKPDSTNYEYWFSAANFLSYANNLKIVRAKTANMRSAVTGLGLNDYNLTIVDTGATAVNSNVDITVTATNQDLISANASVRLGLDANGKIKTASVLTPGLFTPGALLVSANASYTNSNVTFSLTTSAVLIDNDDDWEQNYSGGANTYGTFASKWPGALGNTLKVSVADGNTYSGWTYATQFTSAPGTSTYASNRGGVRDELHVVVVDEDGLFSGEKGTVLEKFAFVSKASDAKDDSGNSSYYKNVIDRQSKYIRWMSHTSTIDLANGTSWGTNATATFANLTSNVTVSLVGGTDGSLTTANVVTAYDFYDNSESVDISLVISGPANQTIVDSLISMAETRKDCVVFLSPEKSDVVDNAGDEVTDTVAYRDLLTSSSYAVMDGNWKYQYDKYSDVYRWIPLNGDVAGLCARTDQERDPWFSPGGLNRGIIKNIIKLAYNPTKTNRDDLYVKGVNPIVTFAGEGTVLFGDKTLQSKPSAFDRINVRRLFIVLEKAIARAAKYSLFEFNDQFTRAQFVALVEPFLRDVQGRRGITDFRVVCDETNNTGEVIDRNEFIGDIYIKPARSINFIQLNFVAVRTGVSFDEVVGKF